MSTDRNRPVDNPGRSVDNLTGDPNGSASRRPSAASQLPEDLEPDEAGALLDEELDEDEEDDEDVDEEELDDEESEDFDSLLPDSLLADEPPAELPDAAGVDELEAERLSLR